MSVWKLIKNGDQFFRISKIDGSPSKVRVKGVGKTFSMPFLQCAEAIFDTDFIDDCVESEILKKYKNADSYIWKVTSSECRKNIYQGTISVQAFEILD